MDTSYPLHALVASAREGDQRAWNAIVERFLPLVCALVRRHRLSQADGDDVSQTVWLRLVEHLDALREPDALPGWISTTTRNECLRVRRMSGRLVLAGDDELDHVDEPNTGIDAGLPVQFHVGYGDADVDLHRCDPLLLTDLLRATEPAGVPVLLDDSVMSAPPSRPRCRGRRCAWWPRPAGVPAGPSSCRPAQPRRRSRRARA